MDLTALPALAAACSGIKALYDMTKDSDNTSFNSGLMDITGKLIVVQGELIKLQEENFELRAKLRQINDAQELRKSLKPKNNVYWRLDGSDRDGPFCQLCFDVNSKLVRLRQLSSNPAAYGSKPGFYKEFHCDIHGVGYFVDCYQTGEFDLT